MNNPYFFHEGEMITIRPGETSQEAIVRYYKVKAEDNSLLVHHFLNTQEGNRRTNAFAAQVSKILSAGWRLPFGFRLVRVPKHMEGI